MNSYPIRGGFKPNQRYVCLSCLLGRPLAPRRRTLRYKSTDAIGVYPTPDHSVAALLWSQEEAIAKAAKHSGAAENEAAQGAQTEPGNVVPRKSASTAKAKAKAKAKTKVKRDGKSKVSKASGHQPKAAKSRTTAGKSETIFSVPKPTPITKGPPVRKPPKSLRDSLRETIAQVAKASLLDVSKVLSNKDEHLEQTQESERERTASPGDTVTSGPPQPGKVGSAVKAAKRSKKASSSKSDKLAEHKKKGLAKAPANGSGMVKIPIIKKYKSDGGNAKSLKAKAPISPRIRKTPPGGLIRKLGGDGGVVARKLRSTLDLNAVIKKTEAALERRDQDVRREAKKERLTQTRRRSQGAPVRFSKKDGAVSKKEALMQESGGALKAIIGTDVQEVNAAELDIAPIPIEQAPVPGLSYGLERVLFNPGVYNLQDPRSRVFNFDPYLQTIMPVSDFDFNALKEYITSSRDEYLKKLAESHGKRYIGSSSSMTTALSHFHFLLSQWRQINSTMLSRSFSDNLKSFTKLQRAPSAVFLRWKNGTYAIDADKEFDSANILMMLGKSMEKLLTLSTEDYERYRVSNSHQISSEERSAPETYHYSTMGDFLMRSQLDAHDPRLPGTGMFDLKTRAVVSIRMDTQNYEDGVGYQIRTSRGTFESYEREFYDMIRAAFLKYSLQVRMGRMDGIFVAYHNIERIFGFQYISLPEMDATLHGQYDTSIGDQEFKLSLHLLNKILDKATKRYPEQSLRIHFETRDTQTPFMYIFAEPVTEEQVHALQATNKEKIEEFERNILGLNKNSAEDGSASKDKDKWADIRADVEEAMTKDAESLGPKSNEEPILSAVEDTAERGEDDTTPEHFETINRRPLYEGEAPLEADHNAAAATADEVEAEDEDGDEDENDNILDEEEDQNAEDEGENDVVEVQAMKEEGKNDNAEVQEVEEENEAAVEEEDEAMTEEETGADIEEKSGVVDEEVEEVDEDGNAEKLDAAASSTTESDADSLDSVAEAQDSTGENETPESMAAKTDPADPDNLSDQAEAEGEGEGEDSHTPGDASFLDSIASTVDASPERDILALTLTIRNKVNDAYVLRPSNFGPADAWTVEYSIAEVSPQTRAWTLYEACQARRKAHLVAAAEEEGEEAKVDYYLRQIQEYSRKGREWRMEQDRLDKGRPVYVVGEKGPRGEGKADVGGEGDGGVEGGRE